VASDTQAKGVQLCLQIRWQSISHCWRSCWLQEPLLRHIWLQSIMCGKIKRLKTVSDIHFSLENRNSAYEFACISSPNYVKNGGIRISHLVVISCWRW